MIHDRCCTHPWWHGALAWGVSVAVLGVFGAAMTGLMYAALWVLALLVA